LRVISTSPSCVKPLHRGARAVARELLAQLGQHAPGGAPRVMSMKSAMMMPPRLRRRS
jgi:hypothetical protein